MNYEFDVLAHIGRFQIFTLGHKANVVRALELARVVAMVIGSHDQPRSPRNPLTTSERIDMITKVFPNEVAAGRIVFLPQINTLYNDPIWVKSVRTTVTSVANRLVPVGVRRIGLIGHAKDATSYYLGIFPGWEGVEVPNVSGIDATTIRNSYFGNGVILRDMVPSEVALWLEDFKNTEGFAVVAAEYTFDRKYKKPYKKLSDADLANFAAEFSGLDPVALLKEFNSQYRSPYPPTFHTVDTVVTQSNHVLLVKRGAMPGKGLWALPGGFLDQNETTKDGALRELTEETQIALSRDTLERCIRSWRTFDDPNRSSRGRTLTTAYHIELRNSPVFPKVKAADDAADCVWMPLDQIERSVMFEDHYDIITAMIGAM